ncbi:zinc-ribbon domain-containing protein [Antarcticimicrobium luteum]|uniref:Thioredoxin n=1 Tax=Antarcticimicrobium luteum TaxID=2547397 RepID=A0A4R5UTF6_9RHOB|nr:zinc-ribbon domain-containing protein [Antarcticimicrobium luteum]TDK42305.1 thioredoxin [Antarcticimicrobium luteum]
MRLTCPNCGAQYEVPDEVIPFEGRDVQCSNCGDTWFVAHPETAAEADRTRLDAARDAVDREEMQDSGGESWEAPLGDDPKDVEPEAESEDASEPWDAPGDAAPATPEDAPEPAFEPAPEPPRQELDVSVSEILRAEAEHEAQLRAAEGGGLESQPELGLDNPPAESARHAREARDRMARLRGHKEPGAEAAAQGLAVGAANPTARRELLPDIEEINSTLRSSSSMGSRADEGELPVGDEAPARRGGFMRGFSVALLIGAALVLVYVNAPRIAQTLPQADPALSAYVAMVDQLRYWLDAQIGDFVTKVLPE